MHPGRPDEDWIAVSANSDDYLNKVKAEIRAEADAARARAPRMRREDLPVPAPVARADGIDPARRDYAIGELTGTHYSTFVDQAFRAVLKRAPDDAGAAAQVRLLGQGASKAEVLGNLRWSSEGRRIGTHVRGLLPRYVLAKLARVPLLGYAIDWAMALAALPLLLRHQRAADTQVAARFDAAADMQRQQESHLATLYAARDAQQQQTLVALTERVGGLDAMHEQHNQWLREDLQRMQLLLEELQQQAEAARQQHASRAAELAAAIAARSSEVGELRHYVHAANHWIASMQASVASLDEAVAAEREQADALAAVVGANGKDTADRSARYTQWAVRLAAELPPGAKVLDIGSGDGAWLQALAAHAVAASGVETNRTLVAQAQARDLRVAAGDAQSSLAHCALASLQAVTLDCAAIAGEAPFARVLAQILDALVPGGWLLLRVEDHAWRAIAIAPMPQLDAARWADVLAAAGFANPRLLPAHGASAVLAQRPLS